MVSGIQVAKKWCINLMLSRAISTFLVHSCCALHLYSLAVGVFIELIDRS